MDAQGVKGSEVAPPARDAHGRLLPGHTANPGGYPKALGEVQRLAREHAPRAIERLGQLLELDIEEHGKVVHAAAVTLLERGFGKPAQTVRLDDPSGAGLEEVSREQIIALLESHLAALKAPAAPAQEPKL